VPDPYNSCGWVTYLNDLTGYFWKTLVEAEASTYPEAEASTYPEAEAETYPLY